MSSLDTRTYAEFAQGLAAETERNGIAGKATQYALEVTTASEGSLDVLNDERLELAAASSDRATSAGEIQGAVGEGPGYDAAHLGQTVLVQDTAHDPRWPQWGPAVAELGLNCVISTPLRTSGNSLGAIYVFSSEPERFNRDDAANLQLLCTHAAIALRSAQRQESLRNDMRVRNMIGQAQGILMEHYRLDAQTAADMLRAASQRTESSLHAVAERVVATSELPTSS